MQRVIGLDIGSYSIKAVEIVNTFKSYEITNFYENVIPHIEELPLDIVIPACMEQLFKENKLEADRIITAMPGQYISSRIMSFNFSDPRKVSAAIVSEIEDAVPFNLDDMIIDHQILGTMEGKTVALVVMTRKNFMRSFLEYLHRINIDPKLVDVDSLSFYNLSSYIGSEPGEVIALVDVGHEKTSVCIVKDGVLRMFRSINLGGRYLSDFLARDLEVDFNEAQRIKHSISNVLCSEDAGAQLSGEEKMVAERLTLAANAIVKELGRTLYAFKTWEKVPISKMLISGGTTQIRNFDTYLHDQLDVPVSHNRLDMTSLKINPNLADSMTKLPQGVAIGLRAVTAVKRYSEVNLRKGEFAYVQNYETLLRGSGTVLKVVAAALLLLSISYGLKHFFYKQQIDLLQAKYKQEYAMLLPDLKKKHTPGYPFSKIRSEVKAQLLKEIEQKRTAVNKFIDDNSGSHALIALNAISEKIPTEVKVDITLYKFMTKEDGSKIQLEGETDGFASVETVKESLKNVTILSDIEEKSTTSKPGSDGKVKVFKIQANYTGNKSGGGKG